MAQPVISFGLSTVHKGESIPLKDVSVRARIQGYLVGVASTLRYANDSEDPLEVVFRFPVDDSWAVVGLEATIGGRTVKGVVREKEEAYRMYDDALASGFSAALGEEKTGDIFSITLGNLPPKDTAEVRLRLVGELPVDAEGGVRFSLPSVLKPRYTPAGSTDPLAPVGSGSEGDQITSASSPSAFSFSLEVADEEGVAGVESPTHSVSCGRSGGKVQVSLGDGGPLKEDLVIQVHYKEPHQPKAICEGGVGEGDLMGSPVVMLNFFPKFETTQAACEFIFLIDRSGSMGFSWRSPQSPIQSARETMILFLKSLPAGCHFNIIGFGSTFSSLFHSSVPYKQSFLDQALKHAESMQADLGGTELLPPLQHIFRQRPLPGLPRQVFVLTDGSVSNTATCIAEVKRNVKYGRCFTFGIGSGASTALVKGLAKAGNGTAEFVQHGERLQPKVISSLKRALQPSVTDLSVEFKVPPSVEVQQAPSHLPTVFNGDKTVIYGVVKPKDAMTSVSRDVSGEAVLRGTVLGKSIEHRLPFRVPMTAHSREGGEGGGGGGVGGRGDGLDIPLVHHLAAKSLIADWQEEKGLSSLSAAGRKGAIVRLSVESSIVSQHTAYVLVDEGQNVPIQGAIKTWDITAESMAPASAASVAFGQPQPLPPTYPRHAFPQFQTMSFPAAGCSITSGVPSGGLFGQSSGGGLFGQAPGPGGGGGGLFGQSSGGGGGLFGQRGFSGQPDSSVHQIHTTSFGAGGLSATADLFGGQPRSGDTKGNPFAAQQYRRSNFGGGGFSFGGAPAGNLGSGGGSGLSFGAVPPGNTMGTGGGGFAFGAAPASNSMGGGGGTFTFGTAPADNLMGGGYPFGAAPTGNVPSPTNAFQQPMTASLFESDTANRNASSLFSMSGSMQPQPQFAPTQSMGLNARQAPSAQQGSLGLVLLQQIDGSWALDAALASILGRSVPELEAGCPVRCEGDMRTIWATVLAVVYLETRHGAQRDEWELVAMKAESWLQARVQSADLSTLKKEATKCF